ncbi:cytochrome P450 [Aspergillus karnatakaensis]|uniref:cytochrome P450 n=1 Tax=Aspergillus karnatakaensis TaxID=1810916 RepID=UPI003CCDBB16
MACHFYLVGDEPSTAQAVEVHSGWKFEDLQRAVGLAFRVAQPLGISFHDAASESLTTVESILAANTTPDTPLSLRIDSQPVQDPQGPPGLPLVGSFYEIYPDHLGNHARLFRKYGPVIRTTNMGKTIYLTDDPRVAATCFSESVYMTKKINENHPLWGVKDNTAIFIGDTETENWRLAHKYLPPAMGPKAVRHYTTLMQTCVRKSLPIFDELDTRGECWNVYQYMVKLASETIGSFSLGKEFGHFKSIDSELHPIVTNIASLLSLNKKITARGEWYRHLPFGDPARLRTVQHTIYTMLQDAVDSVAATSTSSDAPTADAALSASCVVDYLLHAVDDKGAHFPQDLILANMIIVTGAGFTTTSALLSWLIYSLVTYEGTQERLYAELIEHGIVRSNGETNTTTWTPDLAHSLPYLNNFIKETQRLHNPSFQPGRTTKSTVILPGGYRLPPESVIVPALYAIHTNPKIWRDPLRFDPDRWETEEVKEMLSKNRCAYVPFATGARGCIGFNFALLEVKILLSELVSRYEFVREGVESVDYDPEFQLVRPLNFYVRAKRRT